MSEQALRARIAELERERDGRHGLPPTMAQMPGHYDGPVISRADTTGWAHCSNMECPGLPEGEQPPQERVAAVKETQAWTYGACGGDGMYADYVQNSSSE